MDFNLEKFYMELEEVFSEDCSEEELLENISKELEDHIEENLLGICEDQQTLPEIGPCSPDSGMDLSFSEEDLDGSFSGLPLTPEMQLEKDHSEIELLEKIFKELEEALREDCSEEELLEKLSRELEEALNDDPSEEEFLEKLFEGLDETLEEDLKNVKNQQCPLEIVPSSLDSSLELSSLEEGFKDMSNL